MKPGLAIAGALLLAGCGGAGGDVAVVPAPPGWRALASAADRERLRTWREAWVQALAKAQPRHATELADAGAILQPDAALGGPAPPPGDYRCRVFKLGGKAAGNPDYVASPAFACRIAAAGALLRFVKRDGSQRPDGLLYPAGDDRMVFLGTLMLSDETMALQYGRDPERDMIGALERIGARHWRLVLPWPRWESTLDVIDLVPADG